MNTRIIIVTAIAIASIAAIGAFILSNNQGDTDMDQESNTVHIGVGEEWVLSLDENPTTGYAWSVTSSDGLNVESTFKQSINDEDIVGAGGTREYRISADEPGEYVFSAEYTRPWESSEYDKTVSFKLIVGSDM